MTNEEIDLMIERGENALERSTFLAPTAFWFISLAVVFVAFLSLSVAFALFIFCVLAVASLFSTVEAFKLARERKGDKARLIWENFGHNHNFGPGLSGATRQLGNEVQKIYDGDSSGALFPLRQSIRLIDTHHRQQQRLQLVENRLRELRGLQESLAGKMAQLQQLGEDYPQGARNLEQINFDLDALRLVHGQIRGSCTRLEAIVVGVQKAVYSRQLRRELEGLSAHIAPASATEPAFAPESLEEIERQIGREIETYLQLERETDEHLR